MLATTAYIPPISVRLLEIWPSLHRTAQEHVEAYKLEGLLFLGDLNARHTNWNDNTANPHGVLLDKKLYSRVKTLNKGEPTFLACNGNSVIDLCLISGKITNQTFTLATDEDVELFTGAPNRGHRPATAVWSRPSTLKENHGLTKPTGKNDRKQTRNHTR